MGGYGHVHAKLDAAGGGDGLATCPQEVWANWPDTVGAALNLPSGLMLFAGMSLGYADTDSPMNRYRTPRAEVGTFATFRNDLAR
jgi:nitroreductase